MREELRSVVETEKATALDRREDLPVWKPGLPLLAQVMQARSLTPLSGRDGEILALPDVAHEADEDYWRRPALAAKVLEDPFKLQDMVVAADILKSAIERRARILVHGDYDTDGVTATAILLSFLRDLGLEALHYIPGRLEEGYGLSEAGCAYAEEQGADLVLTVDCGSQSLRECARLRDAGMRVIITDHHRCGETLPDCDALINPNRPDAESDIYKDLSGAGVAFKLTQAVNALLDCDADLYLRNLDLAALGTVGDQMLLLGENRQLVRGGLDLMHTRPRLGLQTLLGRMEKAAPECTAQTLGFTLSPRINACGRMDTVEPALNLLLTRDAAEAAELAEKIEVLNDSRRETENQVYEAAIARMAEVPEILDGKLLLVDGENWHPGVIGIVASRILEQFQRPVIVLSLDPESGRYRGSGRACGRVNLLDLLAACEGELIKFGGHKQAAGLELEAGRLPAFREAMRAASDELSFSDIYASRSQIADMELPPEALTLENAEDLQRLEPFGRGNPEPLFLLRRIPLASCRAVGKTSQHLRIGFRIPPSGAADREEKSARAVGGLAAGAVAETPAEAAWVNGIYFRHGALAGEIDLNRPVDILASLRVNCFRDQRSADLYVEDMRFAAEKPLQEAACDEALERFYRRFPDLCVSRIAAPFALDPKELLPSPELLKGVWRELEGKLAERPSLLRPSRFIHAVAPELFPAAVPRTFLLLRCLDIYAEAGLLIPKIWRPASSASETEILVLRGRPTARLRLSECSTYKRLQGESPLHNT